MLIDGRAIADKILSGLRKKPAPKKILAAVLAGNNAASVSFLKQKEKTAKIFGVRFKIHKFPTGIPAGKLKAAILKLNKDNEVGGIIIQLPLPPNLNRDRLTAVLDKKKDIDALSGSKLVEPPSVGALRAIFRAIKFDPQGKNAVVVGRGFLVGEPIAKYLKPRVKQLVITDKDELNIQALKKADLVVSGVGEADLVKGDYIKKGSVLIDYGYSFDKRGTTRTTRGLTRKVVRGDIDFESCRRKASYLTPTPGGTGPIVVAEIFRNFYELNAS